MDVKFLKGGKGDCIIVSCNGEHMLIDGGDDSQVLLKELDSIYKKGESIKYVIITHHDSDHIKGIIDFFNELKAGRYGDPLSFVSKVYFNSARLIKSTNKNVETDKLSYKQALKVDNQINELNLNCGGLLIDTSDELIIGETLIKCLSPTIEILEKYQEKTPEQYLSNYTSGDWDKSLKDLSPFISDVSLDKSQANLTSIVLQIKHKKKSGLLTGDVTPKRFEEISDLLFRENGNKKFDFDFIKLPHHGSHRSITKDIVSKFNCNTYVISTNGKNHFLPNKKCLLKIMEYRDIKSELNFVFNYSDLKEKLNFTLEEMQEYNFKLNDNILDYGIYI